MVKVKSLEKIKANYTGASGVASTRYAEAIPEIAWQKPAIDGQKLYEERMRDAAVLARRGKKIAKVSDAEFQKAMADKGAPVLGSRIAAAGDKQSAGYAPYKAALEAVTLKDRTADAMLNIDQRSKPVVKALVDKKREIG